MNKSESNNAAKNTWNKYPVGGHRSDAIVGNIEYYSDLRRYRYEYETPFIPEFFGFKDLIGKKVLEIGVGNGIDAVEMLRSGAIYYGLDVTLKHIELAENYIKLVTSRGNNFQFKEFYNFDICEKNIDIKFDVIYSFGVLHHICHELDYLKKCHSLLNSDGELRFAVYSKFSLFNLWLFLSWLYKDKMKHSYIDWRSHITEASNFGEPVYINIRSKREVLEVINQSGFEVISYAKKGFVQGYLPLLGKHLSPKGVVLGWLGSIFGWYHCFICKKIN